MLSEDSFTKKLKINIDRHQSPSTWVRFILESAKTSSNGVVEHHLVGARLARRFPEIEVPNCPAHAGDFAVANLVYHVTATPGRNVIQKCAENIKVGMLPILLVPEEQVYKATALAQDEGVDKEMSIISIEAFIAMNIIELATEQKGDFFAVLQEIVQIYNKRLAEVETDLSLQIEVR